jgi:hypothetical protein
MEVERCANPSRDELCARYLRPNRPVVIRGPVPSSSLATLAARYATSVVTAEGDETFIQDRSRHAMPLGELVDSVRAGSPRYRLRYVDAPARLPELERTLATPQLDALLPAARRDERRTLWISPRGNTSSLHHDSDWDNLNLQVEGEKVFLLIPPAAFRRVCAHGNAQSPIDPFAPDLARFPAFADVPIVEARLAPGDVLFIPRYWWHCARAEDVCVNYNVWFLWDDAPGTFQLLADVPLWPRLGMSVASVLRRRHLGSVAVAGGYLWRTAAGMSPRARA